MTTWLWPARRRMDHLRRVNGHRSAFTLLETLLAITLMMALMAAMVASTGLYAKYRFQCEEGNRKVKILTGLMEDLRDDLRACYPGEVSFSPNDHERTKPNASSEENPRGDMQEQFLNWNDRLGERAIHFVGRPDAFLLLREGSNRQFPETQQDYVAQRSHVLWMAPQVSLVRIPCATRQSQVIQRDFRLSQKPVGLKRLPISIHEGESSLRVPGTIDRAPEIYESVLVAEFRYFDGSNWRKEWDSHRHQEEIPHAIEMRIITKNDSEESMRFVIRLPAANRMLDQATEDRLPPGRLGQGPI